MRHALFFCSCGLLSAMALASGMVVGPARIELHMLAGESQTSTITVSNPESVSRRFRLQVVPFTLTETGDLSMESAPPADSAAADWIQINPEEVEIGAEQAVSVRVQVTAPAGSKGTVWAGILVSIPPAGRAQEGFGVTTEPRVLVPVYLTVNGTEKTEVEIVDLQSVRDRNGVFHFRAGLHNSGNSLIRPAGSWLLEENTPNGPVELLVVPFSGEPVLPGQLRKFEGEARGRIPSENLTASVFFDYGPKRGDMVSQSVPVSAADEGPARETRELASAVMPDSSARSPETSAARPVRISYRKEGIFLEAGETIRYRSESRDSPPALFLDLVGYRIIGPRHSGGARLVDMLTVAEIQAKPVVTRLEVRFKVPVEAKVLEQPTGLLIALTPKTR
ncbi:MAG: hypothetical protein ABI968_00170 [Acidobacteriota bacterium]